jgi:hypothetical protein
MLFAKILKHRKVFAAMFVWAMFLGCLPLNATAMPLDSKTEMTESYRSDLETISRFLEEEAVAKRLANLGLSAEQIETRLSSLDRQQIHHLANRIESVEKAGGSGLAVIILAVLVFALGFLYFTNRRITVEKTY